MDSVAISASLFCIVMSSVLTGTALPFGLAMMGIDPANAGTSVQVLLPCMLSMYTCLLPHSTPSQLQQTVRRQGCRMSDTVSAMLVHVMMSKACSNVKGVSTISFFPCRCCAT